MNSCHFVLFFLTLIKGFSFQVSYLGQSVECDRGCGDLDTNKMLKIGRIFYSTTQAVFKEAYLLDEKGERAWITPWETFSADSFDYDVYDWKIGQGRWITESRKNGQRKRVDIDSYSSFIEAANFLREDLHFYYILAPQYEAEFYRKLIARLNNGLEEGYAFYSLYLDDIEFAFYGAFGHQPYGTSDIKRKIQRMKDYIEKDSSYINENYERAKERIEGAINRIDALF